jgi:nucleoside-diphosphate-sugar epimerase
MLPLEDLDFIAQNLTSLKEYLSNKTIFITGGTGFIGKWLVEGLIHFDKSIKIILLSRNTTKAKAHFDVACPNHTLTFIEGDVRDFEYPKEKVDYVIHAATDASAELNNDYPTVMMDIIYQGTKHTLDLAVRDNAKTLFVSSGAVYGKQPDTIDSLSETYNGASPMNTHLSAYGATKAAAEVMCQAYKHQHKVHVSIARCFAFMGAYLPLDTHFAIGNFINNALKGEDIIVKSDGRPLRTYMYAADLVVWLITILCKAPSGEAYNVGGEETLSIKDLAYIVNKLAGKGGVQILNQNPPIYVNLNYVCDVNKAKTELGLENKVTLNEGLQKMINYYK